jgi:hypothetical protein
VSSDVGERLFARAGCLASEHWEGCVSDGISICNTCLVADHDGY